MSNVASLELSKELYELSGWDLTRSYIVIDTTGVQSNRIAYRGERGLRTDPRFEIVPVYDLGYLLRKLPRTIDFKNYSPSLKPKTNSNKWVACYGWIGHSKGMDFGDAHKTFYCEADTPEDAVCKLAIELFKNGVLTKEGK